MCTRWARCLVVLLPLTAVSAQQDWWTPAKRPLTAADYGRFENLGGVTLSTDGRFCAWTIRRVDGTGALRICRVGAAGREGERREIEQGTAPAFSKDGRWLAYRITVTEAESEKLRKAKKPVRSKLGLMDLRSGERTEVDGVSAFRFSDDGKFLAIQRTRPKGQTEGGAQLLVRDLGRGVDTTFGHVGAYAWRDDASVLALVIDAPEQVGNGVQLYDAAAGSLRALESAKARYRNPTWRRDGADLAVLRRIEPDDDASPKADDDEDEAAEGDSKDDEKDRPSYLVVAWRGLDGEAPQTFQFDPREATGFPDGARVVTAGGPRWADKGDALFFSIQEREPKAELPRGEPGSLRADLDEPAGVEVWHPKDIEIIPRQKKTLTRDRDRRFLSAVWLDDGAFVRLADDLTESVSLVRGERAALGRDNTPYETEKRFGPTLFDVFWIDTRSGAKQKILERRKYVLGASPDGRFIAYSKGGHVWTYEVATSSHRNLTDGAGGEFQNRDRGTLTDEPGNYGVAGWTEDGTTVLLNSRWDLWSFRSDGSESKQLTRGAKDRVRHRLVMLDPDPARRGIVDLNAPLVVSVYGDRTKRSGYARLQPGGAVDELVAADKSIGRLILAEDADVYAYVLQAFDDAPDVFVTADDFSSSHQVSATNARQAEFHWGRAELVDYENDHGEHLQGALHYPAEYDAGQRYPMITLIYELRSQNLHRWSAPSERNAYNPTVYTTQGYFVFQPDIVYRAQNPGLSALECVVPAVRKVLERDDVDPARVGLVGHSWGAYQTAFLVTHCDVFAAGVAGAPLTNMISMSMSVYWNSGQTDTWIFHESQGRMDQPFWQDLDTYVANSPIFGLDDMKTPLLVAFGDEDGAVDWNQGVEMFNAARLAQKPVVMLVYPGENHGLRKKPNQVDYHHRVLAWFGHYLKDDSAPKWITEGQSWVDHERELDAFKKARKTKGKSGRKKGGKKSSTKTSPSRRRRVVTR